MYIKPWKSPIGLWLCWPIIILCHGCAGPDNTLGLADLENLDPAIRIRAIKWAGQNQVKAAVPLLVDRLAEQEDTVRFFAISALRRITGTDHGYDYKADAAIRSAAIARWREAIAKPGT